MNKCTQFKDYILNNLSEKDAREFEAHMDNCEPCSREYERENILLSALNSIPMVSPPHEFSNTVLKDIMLEKNSKVAWRIYAASILVIALFAGFFADISVKTVAGYASALTDMAVDFGSSLYVAINNITTVLYNNIGSSSVNSGVLVIGVFFIAGLLFYKTVFAMSAVRKR